MSPLPLLLLTACAAEYPACEGYGAAEMSGSVAAGGLDEASGLAASPGFPGALWSHNDRGDSPRIFALGSSGSDRGEWSLPGAAAVDWEDMAAGPAGEGTLYIGDIGDNDAVRASVVVYRVPEPDPNAGGGTLEAIEALELVYPDGPHDAEALLIEPDSGDLYIATKGDESAVFRATAPLDEGPTTLEEVARAAGRVTGGDISPDGSQILLRTTDRVWVYARGDGESLADALAATGCAVAIPDEREGEAVAATDEGFYTLGEGAHATLHWTPRL